jgi:hypothetical protein
MCSNVCIDVVRSVSFRYITAGSEPQFAATLHNVLVLSFPTSHNKHSNVQLQLLSLSLSLQITTLHHAIKTDCGFGVAAANYSCCDILVVVGDLANKI